MKVGILVFPGSNCDRDLGQTLTNYFHAQVEYLWHTNAFAAHHDIYFIPGGFSYGDYLRSGALAAAAPSIISLKQAVGKGKAVIGICNGFQILCECKLLPGALIRNQNLQHICDWAGLKGDGILKDYFPSDYALPVSHGEGNYICSEENLTELEQSERIFMRYRLNINGSTNDIAGIMSKDEKIIGLMPHPERAILPTKDYNQSSEKPGSIFINKIFEHLGL